MCCILLAVTSLASGLLHCSRVDDIEEFFQAASIPPKAASPRGNEKWEIALEWRLEKQILFDKAYENNSVEFSRRICSEFATQKPRSAFLVALAASPKFVEGLVQLPDPDNLTKQQELEDFLQSRETLRAEQVQFFVNNPKFRRRYLSLSVWESHFLGHHWTNEISLFNRLLTNCYGIQKHADRCASAYSADEDPVFQKFPAAFHFRALLLMGLTSRDDLIADVAAGTAIEKVFDEWYVWFEKNKLNLVQRRDGLGWVMMRRNDNGDSDIDHADAPGLLIEFPQLLLPGSPLPQMINVDPELRRSFWH
jgi:hypothetical protein